MVIGINRLQAKCDGPTITFGEPSPKQADGWTPKYYRCHSSGQRQSVRLSCTSLPNLHFCRPYSLSGYFREPPDRPDVPASSCHLPYWHCASPEPNRDRTLDENTRIPSVLTHNTSMLTSIPSVLTRSPSLLTPALSIPTPTPSIFTPTFSMPTPTPRVLTPYPCVLTPIPSEPLPTRRTTTTNIRPTGTGPTRTSKRGNQSTSYTNRCQLQANFTPLQGRA